MNLLELKAAAEARGQYVATVMILGVRHALAYVGPLITLDNLAQQLDNETWKLWCDDALIVQDDDGVGIPSDIPMDWSKFGIINFIQRPVSRLEAT